MLKFIDKVLIQLSPFLHRKLKNWLNNFRKKNFPKLSKKEFTELLINDLNIKTGDCLFIHSSMRRLYLNFPKKDLLSILQELVGKEGTLIFPCWQFNIRAEDYINENDIIFSQLESPSAMGKLSDVLRSEKNAFRSFHPTNSVISIGKHAKEITTGHENDIYPCGESSPFFKMMKFNAKVIGIGVTVDNLTFVHVIEDTMKERFPLKTRMDKVFDCLCINKNHSEIFIKTKVASKDVSKRDVTDFFNKNIPNEICTRIKKKNMDFFSSQTTKLYGKIEECAEKNLTIYL